jgi:hypothetical protein
MYSRYEAFRKISAALRAPAWRQQVKLTKN